MIYIKIMIIIICLWVLWVVYDIYTAPLVTNDGKYIYNKKKQKEHLEDAQKELDKKLGIERHYSNDIEDLALIWKLSMQDYDVNEAIDVKRHPKTGESMFYFSMIKKKKS